MPHVAAAPVHPSVSPSPGSVPYDAAGAPDAFRHRRPLPSCGSIKLPQGRRTPPGALRCLAAAVGTAQGAELAVSRLSVEGDPIVTYFRALPGSKTIEAFVDSTRDDLGRQVWVRMRCASFHHECQAFRPPAAQSGQTHARTH